MCRGASLQFKKQEDKEDKREKPMKSLPENRVVIQVSLEKPQWFLIFLEKTLCWPVPPRLPVHMTPYPLLSLTHSPLLQEPLLNILGVSSQPFTHQLGGLAPLALPAPPWPLSSDSVIGTWG